jgi:hypothetical protein
MSSIALAMAAFLAARTSTANRPSCSASTSKAAPEWSMQCPPCLADDQDAGGDIPGFQTRLVVRAKPPCRDVAQIERGRAIAIDIGGVIQDAFV